MHDIIDRLDIMAKQLLTVEEYANFIDLFKSMNDRLSLIKDEQNNQQTDVTTEKEIKYPYDIEIMLGIKIFRDNQIGQRIELINHYNKSFLKKVMIGEDPVEKVNSVLEYIEKI
jgi:hypothetical protein